jgi:hypothetical protein
MSNKSRVNNLNFRFEQERNMFQKWVPVFQHLGLKPRRFVNETDVIYVCTQEGWFRLSLIKYRKEELNWLRLILGYLEERAFNNWAVDWRKTIVWEENNLCYLIQPWFLTSEKFWPGDPATLDRMAEILADLYRCGKDYRENRGIEICRDRWSGIITGWKADLEMVRSIKEEQCHEKIRKEVENLRKYAETKLSECIANWELGIKALFEHHLQLGVLGHGALLAKYVVWRGHDYYLLNWEHLSFQPKIIDLAVLINDLAFWEPEWIVFFINQYTKLQPLWQEEYHGLKAMLQYPGQLLNLLQREQLKKLDHKMIKEVEKELKRKGRCLEKVWRELGSEKTNWVWQKKYDLPHRRNPAKISLALSPVETWGGLVNDPQDALIHVNAEQKLPSDIWKRLVNLEQDRVFGGQDGGIMEAAANPVKTDDYLEIEEKPPHSPTDDSDLEDNTSAPPVIPTGASDRQVIPDELSGATQTVSKTLPSVPNVPTVLNWTNFPKPLKRGK